MRPTSSDFLHKKSVKKKRFYDTINHIGTLQSHQEEEKKNAIEMKITIVNSEMFTSSM